MAEKLNVLRRRWLTELVAAYEVQFTERLIYKEIAESLPNYSPEVFENIRKDPPADLVALVRKLFDPIYDIALQDEGEESLLRHLKALPTTGKPN